MATKKPKKPPKVWEYAVEAIQRHLADGNVVEALRHAAMWERNMGFDKQKLLDAAAGKPLT